VLLERVTERARIERLLRDARQGSGGALVIRGEPGIGKTSLCRYAIDLAEAMTVVRATGIESETELEYSGLAELCWPLRDRLDELSDNQADALRVAIGLAEGPAPDRFSAGAATLSLLAAAAETRPVLVVVDDAQWLDRSSQDALRFAMRRVGADRVAVLCAAREGEERTFDAPGVEAITPAGLSREAATSLLQARGAGEVADEVAGRLHEATRGNPLALVELPGLLTPEQLAGAAPLGDPLPVGSTVERAFARRAEALPESSRLALLVAVLDGPATLDRVVAALARLDVFPASLEPAENAGLVRLDDGRVEFAHPLVRSGVYHASSPSDRRVAHRALAEVLAGSADADVRAWHLAGAALGPDEAAAEALAAAGGRARERRGYDAASAAFERAARLSPEESKRIDRLAEAAEAALAAGAGERARALLDEALAICEDAVPRARLLALRGDVEALTGSQDAAHARMVEAADLVELADPAMAARALRLAVQAALFAGRAGLALETARRMRRLAPRDGGDLDESADFVLGEALAFAGERAEAAPVLERSIELTLARSDLRHVGRAAVGLGLLDRPSAGLALALESSRRARDDGPNRLAYILEPAAWNALRAGDWTAAVVCASEGLTLATEMRQDPLAASFAIELAHVAAGRGDEPACRARVEQARALAEKHGIVLLGFWASYVEALLELGLGRLEPAVERLAQLAPTLGELGLFDRDFVPEPDLVEACARLGRDDDAHEYLEEWAARGERASPEWGGAMTARCRGILAEDDAFDEYFAAALALHGRAEDAFAEARTRLCYGERLRRAGRRIDARVELRAALAAFEVLEAAAWIERARRELRATGEKLGRRAAATGDELTPQELQVAIRVAEGRTNREVGAALFLSPKTVEFHLARVYRKLGVSSRAELARRFAEMGSAAGEPVLQS
jgi:DNA-binding CsgD family transcriptional regulator